MRFVSKRPTERESLERAENTVTYFAWRPVSCDDGHTYWLHWIVIQRRAGYETVWSYAGFYKRPCWTILSKLPRAKIPQVKLPTVRLIDRKDD